MSFVRNKLGIHILLASGIVVLSACGGTGVKIESTSDTTGSTLDSSAESIMDSFMTDGATHTLPTSTPGTGARLPESSRPQNDEFADIVSGLENLGDDPDCTSAAKGFTAIVATPITLLTGSVELRVEKFQSEVERFRQQIPEDLQSDYTIISGTITEVIKRESLARKEIQSAMSSGEFVWSALWDTSGKKSTGYPAIDEILAEIRSEEFTTAVGHIESYFATCIKNAFPTTSTTSK